MMRGDGKRNGCNEVGEVKVIKLRGGMLMERSGRDNV